MQILCTLPYNAQPSDCTKWCAIFRPLHNRPSEPFYDITFAPRFCTADGCLWTRPWFLTILVTQVYVEFHVIRFFIALNYCLSTMAWVLQNTGIDYSAMKNKNIGICPKKLIDRALPKIQSNLISRACSLVLPTV